MILKIPCHWVLWLKFIAVITDIMACWVARYYRASCEGKKELVIDDYKIVSDWDSCTGWTRTRHLDITIIKLSPAGGSFITSQPAHRCLYLRSNTLTLKTLGLSSKWHLSTLNTGGRADWGKYHPNFPLCPLTILPRQGYNWFPTEKGII